jgi:hypothetical protein
MGAFSAGVVGCTLGAVAAGGVAAGGAVTAGGVAGGVSLGAVVWAKAAEVAKRAIDVAAGTIHFMIASPSVLLITCASHL